MRPGFVSIDFPIAEAEGILARLDGDDSLNPDAASGRSRLQTAVNIERGPSGSAEEKPLRTCVCGHPLSDHGQDGPMACMDEDCDCTNFRMFARLEKAA